MRKSISGFIALAAILFTVGCLRAPGGLAPSNTPLGVREYTVIGEAFGSDTHVALVGIIPLSRPNRMQAAIEDAKKKAGADALINVTVESVSKYYFLFSTYTTEVRGLAIKFKE